MITLQYLIIWLALLLPAAPGLQEQAPALKAAVEANFEELNAVRQNPAHYAAIYKVPALRKVPAKPALVWDETLAKLAQQKAEDMAAKNYMEHVDKKGRGMNYYLWQANYPLPDFYSKDIRANNVESIAANTAGPLEFVQQLIIDEGVPNLGHRKHLLGFNDRDTPATHVGIGIAYNPNSRYKYYCSILIAPKMENQ
ncbi:CAP domain-containing protein [Pontibacter diazotrophicus]|uniref:CAP domain-containing protein n=1 Tax=Pontibacter diazotrophicus TaxID=1400979 RepID=A0A3D8L9Z4_9BACT|nr:CAP domain-containing protein [Pontibacter diazotrophicus]RDV14154.1 CAP domain-containing protein [Pontibacter diazotrophicus]